MRHGDDFTEGDIEDIDMEDKQRRKKTLRFYTSKIDKAAAKKEQLFTGDMDVPYKERLFERQQRLIEEARQRGLDKRDIDLPDEELNSANVDDDDDDGYYQSVKQNKIQKKQSRKSAHEAAVKAAKEGKLAELQEGLGEDGKRAINYQILKNKGLTPHRKKEYRNSRVKRENNMKRHKRNLNLLDKFMILARVLLHMVVKLQVLKRFIKICQIGLIVLFVYIIITIIND